MSDPWLSIVIPALNEAPDETSAFAARLERLTASRPSGTEIIVADGGSIDRTSAVASARADRVLSSERGRARQMNAGANEARGGVLLFLHADTALPDDFAETIRHALVDDQRKWGRFDVQIAGAHALLPMAAFMMNARSRLTGIATGDQAIFVRRDAFERAGGFPDIALMEDIAFTKTLRRISRPVCLKDRVTTSGRRWDANGFWRTVFLMWSLRFAWFCGAPAPLLARIYGYGRG